jgi:hypothetical protein
MLPALQRLAPFLTLGLLKGVLGTSTGAALAQSHGSSHGQGAQKAVFATKAEAEAATKNFNCTGAHRMGTQWMPCASHGEATGGHGAPKAP